MAEPTRTTLVTSALPYANGRIHMGHVAGAYLPADEYVRHLRLRGEDVLFICGTDEHGTPITIAADREGVPPSEIVRRYHDSQGAAFEGLRIEFDVWSGTSTSPHHAEMSRTFFRNAVEQGHVEPRVTEQAHCGTCERWLPDRYVTGDCPHCGAPGARGDQCEACGKQVERLDNPTCGLCDGPATYRETKHWFFRLDHLQDRLREWLETKEHWRPQVRNFCLGLLQEGLPPRSITRDLEWGIPVPVDDPDAEGKALYVWFDAPIGYLSFTQELGEQRGDPDLWKRFWLGDDSRLVHFIGKDNTVFHAVIWPIMLMVQRDAGMDIALPDNVPANEWLNFRGEKASKSKGTAVWVHEYLERFETDPVRYFLTATAPEAQDSNWTWEEYVQKNNHELADVFGNFVNRTVTFAAKHMDGRVPDVDVTAGHPVLQELAASRREVAERVDAVRLKAALARAMDTAAFANRWFDEQRPWVTRKEDPEACAATIAACLECAAGLRLLLWPFLPDTCERLGRVLGLADEPAAPTPDEWTALGERRLLTPGAPLGEPEILVRKLDLDEVLDAVGAGDADASPPDDADDTEEDQPEETPVSDDARIEFDDFAKVQLCTARVLEAGEHPNADRLLLLKIDVGEDEPRQIVAGIAGHYAPDDLVGRNIAVVRNLKPAKLRGEVSDGMLLAGNAEIDGETKVVLLQPEQDLPPGTPIK